MRRSVVALIGALAPVVAIASTAVALTTDDDDNDAGHPMQDMMMSGSSRESSGRMRGPGPGRWTGHRVRVAWVDCEIQYLTEMVAHHEEAVAAAAELDRSDRPQMRAVGAAIVATQSAQIAQMERWLDQWYPGRSTDLDYQPKMPNLSGLSSDRLDQAFLQGMIGHHMAAMMMSQQLIVCDLSDHDPVSELAQSIRDEQHAEIVQMQRWLADWFGSRWGHGFGRGMGSGMMS